MTGFLLALILTGAGLHITVATEKQEKRSDVKYNGPVVYTNLPPPVLYFPNFPQSPKLSNRGSAGDTEDKRVEYVPYPYKDLPLLIYQSQNQPPVHVVEKNTNQESGKNDPGKIQSAPGYQTGPAVYRTAGNDQYDNEAADSTNHPQALLASPSDKYINVGLSTSSVPAVDQQNQQYISIGVTSIQPQSGDTPAHHEYAQGPSHVQQSNYFNPTQYSESQNAEQIQYSSQSVGQNEPSYMYYSSPQYSSQSPGTQTQVPVEHITQAIQNLLLQQSAGQQHAQSVQETAIAYQGTQRNPMPSPSSPTQHVGITIIRQPAVSDVPEHGGDSAAQVPYHHPPQIRHPQSLGNNDQRYEENPQYVSIGVYPSSGGEYEQDPQQYYNLVSPVENDNYPNVNEEYRQVSQDQKSSPEVPQNPDAPTTAYQLISIDLNALRNKGMDQERNAIVIPNQQTYQNLNSNPPRPMHAPPPQDYRVQNLNDGAYGSGEKEYQHIVIQIPQNILSEQSGQQQRPKGPNELPYTGTAQVANILGDSRKASNSISNNRGHAYNRPPKIMQQSERGRNPSETYGFPQTGALSNGINIAIIKQTDSTNNSPSFKSHSSDNRPHINKMSNQKFQMPVNRYPPKPYSHKPPRPSYGHQGRPFPPRRPRHNRGYEMPAVPSAPYPITSIRYPLRYGRYRSRPIVPQLGGHPGIYASSNLHYTAMHPPGLRQPFFGNDYTMSPSMPFHHVSTTKNTANFDSSALTTSMPFNPLVAETTMQALTNNISNSFGDANFDEINAFLSPNYDFFGSMAYGQDKKVEDETKFIQKITSDVLSHDIAAASMAAALPPYGIVKPPPSAFNAPLQHKYWENPAGNFGPPSVVGGIDHPRLLQQYTHLQQHSNLQHPRGKRPFSLFNRTPGKKRVLGKGNRRLKNKIATLRSSIRQKSKIAPRQEITSEEGTVSGIEKVASDFTDSSIFDNASPRSTIIKTQRARLDGITIPLNPDHVLSSRVSIDEEETKKEDSLPPIVVYKGIKQPLEVYGSKADIEKVGNINETTTENLKTISSTETPEEANSDESVNVYTGEGSGYLDYMYSMLPDLIRSSLGRRHDDDSSKWLPVNPIEYAIAEDTYDRNNTNTEKVIPPIHLESLTDSTVKHNSSTKFESAIKENVEERFSLLGRVEKSDLVTE